MHTQLHSTGGARNWSLARRSEAAFARACFEAHASNPTRRSHRRGSNRMHSGIHQIPCSARLGSDPPPPDVSTRASKRYIRHHGAFSGQPAPAALAAADEALYMPTPAHVRYPKQVASMRKLATRTVTLLMQYNVLLLRVVQVHFTTY
jgi:hypothetical protein